MGTNEIASAFGPLRALMAERKRIETEAASALGMVSHPSHRIQKLLSANTWRVHYAMQTGHYAPY